MHPLASLTAFVPLKPIHIDSTSMCIKQGQGGLDTSRALIQTGIDNLELLIGGHVTTSTPSLSVIVPMYNAEQTIEVCVESLLSQTVSDLEVIVVDDCSTDEGAERVKELARKDPRIRLVSLEVNSGSGAARNIGIDNARGGYIGFSDSDDWMDGAAYEALLSAAERHGAEIAMCGIRTEWGNFKSSSPRYVYPVEQVLFGKQALRAFTRSIDWDVSMSAIVNNRIYRSDYLKERRIRFNRTRNAQDNYFTFFALAYASKTVLVPEVYYHYRQREGSISHVFDEGYVDGLLTALREIRDDLVSTNRFSGFKDEFYSLLHRCLCASAKNMYAQTPSFERQKELARYILRRSVEVFGFDNILEYFDAEALYRMFLL